MAELVGMRYVCSACETRSKDLTGERADKMDEALMLAGWVCRGRFGLRLWLCPVCSLTPERSAALIALRDGSGPER